MESHSVNFETDEQCDRARDRGRISPDPSDNTLHAGPHQAFRNLGASSRGVDLPLRFKTCS